MQGLCSDLVMDWTGWDSLKTESLPVLSRVQVRPVSLERQMNSKKEQKRRKNKIFKRMELLIFKTALDKVRPKER